MKILTSLSGLLGKQDVRSKSSGRALLPPASSSKKSSAWTKAEEVIISERYKLHKIIGEGGSGRVWLANLPDGKRVALKIVMRCDGKSDSLERERLGVERVKNMYPKCQCLVTIDRVEDHCRRGFFFYTMPLADDVTGSPCVDQKDYRPRTLAEELKSRGRLPVTECVSVAKRVLEALKALHAVNYIHTDVKPANVIYCGGLPVLADIGLVAPDSDEPARSGTRSYMSQDEVKTVANDLYSVAKLLHCMATGNPTDNFGSTKRTITDPLFGKLRDVILMAGDPEPRKRYINADAMIRALDYVVMESPKISGLSKEDFAKLMKESSATLLLKQPDPPDMERFKTYIRNVIEGEKLAISQRDSSYRNFVKRDDLDELKNSLCLEFERRIGHTPRMIIAVCRISEAAMVKDRAKRKELIKEAMVAGFGEKRMSTVLGRMGVSLGWDDAMLKVSRRVVIGAPVLVRSKILAKWVLRLRWVSFAKKIFGRETPQERTEKAFKALNAGMDEAISEIWPEHGKYLRV